jgi:hypothetical protein
VLLRDVALPCRLVVKTRILVPLVMLLAAGCGPADPSAVRSTSSTHLPGDIEVVRVAAGGTNGWVYGTTGQASAELLRFGSREGFTKTANLPSYRSPFATVSNSGIVFVGGVRCGDDACNSSRAEVTRLDRNGSRLGVTVIQKTDTPPGDTTSIGFVGQLAGGIAIATDQGVVSVSDNGERNALSSGPLVGTTCAVGGDIYVVTHPDQRVGSVISLPAAGDPQRVTVSIDELVGNDWQPVTNGQLSVDLPAPANVYCGHDQLLAMSSDVAQGHWTPVGGWTVQPNTTSTPDKASATASTGAWYGLDEHGTLTRRDPSGIPKTLRFTPPQADAVPALIQVDDSGGALFACVSEPTAGRNRDENAAVATTCRFAG